MKEDSRAQFVNRGNLLLGVLARAQDVIHTTYDHDFDFNQLHTFAVQIENHWGDPKTEDRGRQRAIESLSHKGSKLVGEDSADALVLLHGAVRGNQSFRTFFHSMPDYRFDTLGAPGAINSDLYEYDPGSLIIDVFDNKSRKVVFRGMGKDSLSGQLQYSEKKMDKAVKKILNKVPTKHQGEQHGG